MKKLSRYAYYRLTSLASILIICLGFTAIQTWLSLYAPPPLYQNAPLISGVSCLFLILLPVTNILLKRLFFGYTPKENTGRN